jgi:CheY-like chemotaxis protein
MVNNRKRIALIDDEREYLHAIAGVLREIGLNEIMEFHITESHGLKQTAQEVKEFRPHIILIDKSMPSFDGSMLMREIGGEYCLKQNPRVISISSSPYGAQKEIASAHFMRKDALVGRSRNHHGPVEKELIGIIQSTNPLIMRCP